MVFYLSSSWRDSPFFVPAADKFQGFGHNVGRVRIKELCVPVQVESDVFLQADLECRSFRLF
jgi:hypothetical protein